MVDHYAIGRLAADHLLQCGFRRLGYYGICGPWYSKERGKGFRDRAAEAGVPCSVLDQSPATNSRLSWQKRLAPVDKWLQTLKTPVGIFSVHDFRARILLEECIRLGLNVPHDVALIGADNDPTICEICQPTLSSVLRNAWQIGYEAAAMLDKLMSGKTPRQTELVFPPEGIVPSPLDRHHRRGRPPRERRQSTSCTTILRTSRESRASLPGFRFPGGSWKNGFRAFRLLALPLPFPTPHSRRPNNCSKSGEHLKLRSLAKICGFTNSDHLRLVFFRSTGMRPIEYRRKQLSRQRPTLKKRKKHPLRTKTTS